MPKSSAFNPDFDTLIISYDHLLFDQMSNFFHQNNMDRTVKISHDSSELEPIELWLGKCEILICDIRSDDSMLKTATQLIDNAPIHMIAVGLSNGVTLQKDVLSSPGSVRLAGIVNMQEGWENIWRHISSIKFAWNNPLMMSKIEDVPVSDILQMISIGQWNAMVQIQGRTTASKELNKNGNDRICGSIFFWKGDPISAWSSLHNGIQAVCDLISLRQGILRIIRPLSASPFRNIQTSMQDILLSYAVSIDELLKQPLTQAVNNEIEIEETQVVAPSSSNLQFFRDANAVNAIDVTPSVEPQSASIQSSEDASADTAAEKSVFRQPSSFIHPWWSTNLSSLNNILVTIEPRSLPVRWMKTNDIEFLTLPNTQSEFLVFRAPRQFLLPMLRLCARDFTTNKLDEEWVPVLRLGLRQKANLYIACLEIDSACTPLSAFPCAAYSSQEQVHSTLYLCETFGHPVCILLVPDCEETMDTTIVYDNHAPYFRRTIPAPSIRWDSISKTLLEIVTILSNLASEGI